MTTPEHKALCLILTSLNAKTVKLASDIADIIFLLTVFAFFFYKIG